MYQIFSGIFLRNEKFYFFYKKMNSSLQSNPFQPGCHLRLTLVDFTLVLF